MEILNNLLKIYIAKLKLETAVIYSTDLKKNRTFVSFIFDSLVVSA